MSWSFGLKGFERIRQVCSVAEGSEGSCAREPFMILYAEPISPLKHAAEAVQNRRCTGHAERNRGRECFWAAPWRWLLR